jgi:class 3 adenylate cyclase
VDRLVMGEKCISERHESVSMLFSDIVGWTPMSESVPTQQLIALLNDLFSAFDELTEKHGVFKAETIGDAYIVAAGHEGQAGPSDATLRVVEFGLEMLEKVKTIRPPSGMQLQIRVGIHTGPAYSGVVGTKVPKYSFFGDSEFVDLWWNGYMVLCYYWLCPAFFCLA